MSSRGQEDVPDPKGGVGDGACLVANLSTEPADSTRQAARLAQHPPRPGGHCQVSPVCLLEEASRKVNLSSSLMTR